MTSVVGFIGLGNMGGHMARNLMRAGHRLIVHDSDSRVLNQFKLEGAETVDCPADVAASVNRLVTMLPSSPHVKQVYAGEKGILQSLQANTLCLDSSTIDQAVSIEIAALVKEKQGVYLDAPVSGGVVGAQNATLTFMVGGASEDSLLLAKAKELLQVMGKNVVDCGAVGSGQAAKICNNMLLAISMIGTAEAMNMGVKMGLEPKKLASIINTSSGRCWSSEVYNPVPGVVKTAPPSNNYEGGFGSALMAKVLRHEEFEEGCKADCNGPYNGKWSKTMVGYGSEDDHFVLELTYNYEIGSYKLGNDYQALYVDNTELYHRLQRESHAVENGRFRLFSPDGHEVLVGRGTVGTTMATVSRLALHVTDLEKAIEFWCGLLKMHVVSRDRMNVCLTYVEENPVWSLELILSAAGVDRAAAYGRTAFSCPKSSLRSLEQKVKAAGHTVLKPLIALETPGKATVHVVILADPDGHEICFVGEEAFRELSRLDPMAEAKLLKEIERDTSEEWFGAKGKPRVD